MLQAYDALQPVGSFTVAASFGNTHGVYAPGNVKLKPTILRDSQRAIREARKTGPEPVSFVFHGGSGSTEAEIREAVSYGVVKMNIDTDTQWAFTQPIKKYMDEKSAYLQAQLGNPEGPDKPNKKFIDPRGWLHVGEKGMIGALDPGLQGPGLASAASSSRAPFQGLPSVPSHPLPRPRGGEGIIGRRGVRPIGGG